MSFSLPGAGLSPQTFFSAVHFHNHCQKQAKGDWKGLEGARVGGAGGLGRGEEGEELGEELVMG